MRPILKSSASYGIGSTSSSSTSYSFSASMPLSMISSTEELRRQDELFSPSSGKPRRVWFSPFVKMKRKARRISDRLARSTLGASEERKRAIRNQELHIMEFLYHASRRRPHSFEALLMSLFPALKDVRTRVKGWLKSMESLKKYYKQARTLYKTHFQPPRQPTIRLRIRHERWTEYDEADAAYLKQLARTPRCFALVDPKHRLPIQGVQPRDENHHEVVVYRMPQPDLTPVKRGSFVNFLRHYGVAVDEDVAREHDAITEDLRGVANPSIRLKVSSQTFFLE